MESHSHAKLTGKDQRPKREGKQEGKPEKKPLVPVKVPDLPIFKYREEIVSKFKNN